jgi:energy-coupling factor transport system ATP-binding protein
MVDAIDLLRTPREQAMAIVEVKNLTYRYPLTTTPALQEISLNVEEGEFLGIVGPNGAGKSSLCFGISGFLRHYFRGEFEGSIHVDGRSVDESTLGEWILNVGLAFQNPFTQLSGSKLTVYEEIAFGLENIGVPRDEMIERIDEVMALTRISELSERSPYALSGGQQQRVALASIFAMKPKVLVLDEPTSQLDPIGTRDVFEVIREMKTEGVTVIMAEHKIEWLAEFADRVIVMSEGRIVMEGPPEEVLISPILPSIGCNVTRYTSVGRQALPRNLWPGDLGLPITLREAVDGFCGGNDED